MRSRSSATQSIYFLIYTLFLAFIIGFVFNFRAVSSISTGLIILTGIAAKILDGQAIRLNKFEKLFFLSLLLYFILQVIAILYTNDRAAGWAQVQIKSGLVFIPLALFCSGITGNKNWISLFFPYIFILTVACFYCLLMVTIHIHQPFDPSVFFYHQLVSPLNQHAVYFSIYVFVAIIILIESIGRKWLRISKGIHLLFIIFLTIFLLLLSSKLVIAFYILYLVFYFISQVRSRKGSRLLIGAIFFLVGLAAMLVVFTKNPIKERFLDIFKGDIGIVKQEKFDKGDYFNGVQFRILEWKFVKEILDERKAWLKGVTPADAQPILDSLYSAKNIYTGEPMREDKGFLGYNTHNTFLEALLQTGLPGLLVVLLMVFSLLKMIWQKRELATSFIILLLIAWLFSEAAFESQYGILIFTFFPLFFNAGEKRSIPAG